MNGTRSDGRPGRQDFRRHEHVPGQRGLVTLALGAIGIINIMLVAVADRTREIGLRKAVGATNGSIMFQFFVEGAFLTLLSGGIGMAGAAGLMAALSERCHRRRGSIRRSWCHRPRLWRSSRWRLLEWPPDSIRRGARPCLQPVEALRKE